MGPTTTEPTPRPKRAAGIPWIRRAAFLAAAVLLGTLSCGDDGTTEPQVPAPTAGDADGSSGLAEENPDRAVLVALYEATDGPNWVNSENWLTDAPLGAWYGVDTDASGRVRRLSLSGRWDWEKRQRVSHGLAGPIPPQLGDLANLEQLELDHNGLAGPIPPELGDLANLEQLVLRENDLTGPIPPELGNLASLKRLDLYGNDLTGSIPPELGGLASLEWLFLNLNKLSGPIPPELGDLVNLVGLVLSENGVFGPGLSGPIPPELGGLAKLKQLRLGDNKLSGPIPAELGDLANLEWLGLGENGVYGGPGLSGPIPPELGGLGNLWRLSLDNNDLTGPIPPELGNLTKLVDLWLQSNRLSGTVPPELGNLGELRWLDFGNNDLTGPIPLELGNLSKLVSLSFGLNDLTGPIPGELGNLVELERLFLNETRLTGSLPEEFVKLRKLQFFGCRGGDIGSVCVPGTNSFVEWRGTIEAFDGPWCNELDMAVLESFHEAAGGPDWRNSAGWLGGPALGEWHGVEADARGRVTALGLADNGLAGGLPGGLGQLAELTELRIGDNDALSGRLPQSLPRLSLDVLHYGGTDLCVPAEESFQQWLDGVGSHEGTGVQCVPLSDRDVLAQLYRATDGSNWAESDNWLTAAPLGEWHGVDVDGNGRVVAISLRGNRLTGVVPPELVGLANLWLLDLGENDLSGPIPAELGGLANLDFLDLGGNDLSGPIPPELGGLSGMRRLSLQRNDLSGPIPPEVGNLPNLEVLRLFSNDLSGPVPPEFGSLPNLELLNLAGNRLSGAIPPELGGLANLWQLNLSWNRLTGPIPPELGGLPNLELLNLAGNDFAGPIPLEFGGLGHLTTLFLNNNNLSGPIPAELGDLANLWTVDISRNSLSGAIPAELGGLANLRRLYLDRNRLAGPIPAQLGDLANLAWLSLSDNDLSGAIPPELGGLAGLEHLGLEQNDLSGPVPPEFGGLSSLRILELANNAAMAGALPSGMTTLARLDTLQTGGTGLCAPADPEFRLWLDGVAERWIARCATPAAYLTQAVQSREFPVPLVAGERALLRVFPTARTETEAGIPPVRARFWLNGRETHVEDIPGKSGPVPPEVDEGDLAKSANAEIPGRVVRPGLEMVIEIDPDSTLDPELGVTGRIPDEGRLAVEVGDMPVFDLTLIPFVWTGTHDSSIVETIAEMEEDREDHELLRDVYLLPVGEMVVAAHAPVLSSTNNARTLLGETSAIRAMEGGGGHYMGMMNQPVTGAFGVAFLSGRSSFSEPRADIIAHELGHNMSLLHAPCGRPSGVDSWFPNPDGFIGAWGWDFRARDRVVHPSTPDLMSYCGPPDGISDYHFTKALRFRLSDEDNEQRAGRKAAPAKSLLLWGGVAADGVPFLEPAFVVDAPPLLPDSAGAWRLAGRTAGGAELFSLSFAMPEIADGEGGSGFAFVLPVRPSWEWTLASIGMSGPGGSVMLDGDAADPMAILRDPRTGQIRGILRDLPATVLTEADAAAAVSPVRGLEVLFSRGMPGADEWRR